MKIEKIKKIVEEMLGDSERALERYELAEKMMNDSESDYWLGKWAELYKYYKKFKEVLEDETEEL